MERAIKKLNSFASGTSGAFTTDDLDPKAFDLDLHWCDEKDFSMSCVGVFSLQGSILFLVNHPDDAKGVSCSDWNESHIIPRPKLEALDWDTKGGKT